MSPHEWDKEDAAPFAETFPIQLISCEGGSEQGVLSRVPEHRVYTIQDSLYADNNHSCVAHCPPCPASHHRELSVGHIRSQVALPVEGQP